MAHHNHDHSYNLDEKYVFTAEAKKRVITWMLIGLAMFALGTVLLATGILGGHEAHGDAHAAAATAGHAAEAHAAAPAHGAEAHAADAHGAAAHGAGHEFHWYQRIYANIWMNNVFFTGLAIVGVFFFAVQYAAWAGWSASIKRLALNFGSFLPIGLGLILLTFLVAHHDLFHWTHSDLYDKSSPHYDKILDSKSWYLNIPFYLGRTIVFGALWIFFHRLFLKKSLSEDQTGGTETYFKLRLLTRPFIVVFAVSSSMLAWDWSMSLDPHWYSTMFGWYHFASWWVAGLSTLTLTILILKEKGYLPFVSNHHLHDLGKFMFAFSVFWTYLWFSQFMLIYYANIPEEVVYFKDRMHNFDGLYAPLFFGIIIINFVFPFLFLMTRDAKRHTRFLKIAAIGIIAGHWLDFYNIVMPGTLKENSGFGLVEFGLVIFYASLFIYVVSNAIAKSPLVAKNHPMIEESLHHEVW